MSEALLIMAFGLVIAVGFTLGLLRRFREAVAPAGAAASVLRDVYAGRGTQERSADEFAGDPSTSITLDGPDPLRTFGLDPASRIEHQ
ncbi:MULTISPECIES: hypothetical protein [unclassified Rathayibacter]|uniref:hypothetical protein n=1 Tax=unclassified Rathayibacter TaxID=2609250 RepID=UPI001047F35B|nr:MULTISPECIES: hypothetical protein [unclassified Rathayibacter]MCJ1703733.1 hypothetical protein [Rathayibacter sp. VKM Ac-2926]TCL83573.1 hypothetical protein EDF49_1032 [Rathayibacter sp. PhB192]TCM29166.1 hypothetical protein EDF43_1032 [Rathayibacter sp. PhB179]